VERRGQVIRVPIKLVNWQQEEPTDRGEGQQLFMDGTSRVSREAQARFREGLGVQIPGATRPSADRDYMSDRVGRFIHTHACENPRGELLKYKRGSWCLSRLATGACGGESARCSGQYVADTSSPISAPPTRALENHITPTPDPHQQADQCQ
jgi:hypothetical protein